MRRKRTKNSSNFSFFSFLDILFSTMGILVLVSSVNFLLVQFESNSPQRSVYTQEEIQEIISKQDLLGSFYWLQPVYLTISKGQYTLYRDHQKEVIQDQQEIEKILYKIAEANCLAKMENRSGRSVIVFGIYQSGYLYYNSLSIAIEKINSELKNKYGRFFFPLQEGKELLSSSKNPPHWQQIISLGGQ